jgi:hypothetical protein
MAMLRFGESYYTRPAKVAVSISTDDRLNHRRAGERKKNLRHASKIKTCAFHHNDESGFGATDCPSEIVGDRRSGFHT